jgi:hypothetical protein
MIYTVIFFVAIGSSIFANWFSDPSHEMLGFVGCLLYIVPFLLIPFAAPLEDVCIEAAESRRRRNGLPIIIPSPRSERLFRIAVYVALAAGICLFFLGFWLIGYLYPGIGS